MLLFPPVLLARLALPDALGFNVSVIGAVAAAAAGAYLLGRRRLPAQAAALGAVAFALSGPVMSAGNVLNTLWSTALIPWTVWAADRAAAKPEVRRFAILAALFGLQVLAGEPVTLASGVVATFAFACASPHPEHVRNRIRLVASVAFSGLAGLAVAAAQLLPLLDAVRRSSRGIEGVPDILAVHPLALVEAVTGPLFGSPLAPWIEPQPWLAAMNDGNDPYFFSLYVGVPVLALAAVGAVAGGDRRWRLFWIACGAVAVVCALGVHTPVYPLLQQVFGFLRSFRYPSKYTGVAALAIAMLAAGGWEALRSGAATPRAWRPAAVASASVAIAAIALWILAMSGSGALTDSLVRLARITRVAVPDGAAAQVVAQIAATFATLAVASAATAQCIALAAGPSRSSPVGRAAAYVLLALCAVTLAGVNGGINPTLDASLLRSPVWIEATREHPADRFFAPGRIAQAVGHQYDAGIPRGVDPPPVLSMQAVKGMVNAEFAVFPAAERAREGISVDVTQVWSRAYARAMRAFAWNAPSRRTLFLERTGHRYYVDREPPNAAATELFAFEAFPLKLYASPPVLPRAFVVGRYAVLPSADAATEQLFDPAFDPSSVVQLEADPPAAAGVAGTAPGPGSATIVEDGPAIVAVHATIAEGGGFLVLHDSMDPWWTATVDGQPAPVLRANGLFRAVHVSAGDHVVRFAYRPVPFYAGAAVSSATLLLLAGLVLARLGRRRLYTAAHGEETV